MLLTFLSILISLPLIVFSIRIPHHYNHRRDSHIGSQGVIDVSNVGINLLDINALLMKQFSQQILPTLPPGEELTTMINILDGQESMLDNLAQVPEFFNCSLDLFLLESNSVASSLGTMLYLEIILNLGSQLVLRNQTTTVDPNVIQNLTEVIASTDPVIQRIFSVNDIQNSTIPFNLTVLEYAILLEPYKASCGMPLGIDNILPVPTRSTLFGQPFAAQVGVASIGATFIPTLCGNSTTCFCQFINGDEPEADVFSVTADPPPGSVNGSTACMINHLGPNLIFFTGDSTPLSRDVDIRAKQNVPILTGPILLNALP